MDSQTKLQLKAHMIDATPAVIVDGALASCHHLKQDYADAVTSPDVYISTVAGQKLANDWFQGLRDVYINHVDKWLSSPEFAETRAKVIAMQWRKCVTDKATDWSRLRDEASTVGQAAATSCRNYRQNLQTALTYQFRSAGVAASGATEIADKLDGQMKDVATEVVISERAKRLPRP